MNTTRLNQPKNRALFAALLMAASSVLVAVPTSAAAPQQQSYEPNTAQGSPDYETAPLIQYNTAGFWGIINQSSGAIEPIRGCLNKTFGPVTDYYKIELTKGRVLKAVLDTENPTYWTDGLGRLRINPDFQIYVYAGIPDILTNIDWITIPLPDRPTGGVNYYSYRPQQEINILTPVGGGTPTAYYINVTTWLGTGCYTLAIDVSDPTDIGPGVNDFNRTMTAEIDDTHWYRFYATHDSATQTYDQFQSWLRLTNWNPAAPHNIDAIFRIYTDDMGYSYDNPIGKPIQKAEAPDLEYEPLSLMPPYTGYYYVEVRIDNTSASPYAWQVSYNLHTNITPVTRMPDGGFSGIHRDKKFDGTQWFWFNMTKAQGTGQNDRVIFNLSEVSDDPTKPVNMNLWLAGKRPYFNELDILNSSVWADAPYNLTINPEPRYEQVGAQASYTGIYFIGVEVQKNAGNYSLSKRMDPTPGLYNDFNNEPSQAEATDWGVTSNVSLDQSEDHSDFYRVSAKAGETLEGYVKVPRRNSEDGSQRNATLGIVWIGIYQPGMVLLNWSWNYWYDFFNDTDHLEDFARVRASILVDGDYIIEVVALKDGFIGSYTIPGTRPARTLTLFFDMDWNEHTNYTMWVSRLPDLNAFPQEPFITQALPDITLQEDEIAADVLNLSAYFDDPDFIQGDWLFYTFTASGINNTTITERNGLVTLQPEAEWSGNNTFTVTAIDTTKMAVSQKWNITVLPVNDIPYLATNDSIRFAEDSGAIVLTPLSNYVNDVDGDLLTITQVPDPNVTVTFTYTSMRITTVADFQTSATGDYPIQIDVTDGIMPAPVRLTLLLNISNTLDAPRVVNPNPTIACDEDIACPALDLNTIFFDPDDPGHKRPLSFLLSGYGELGYTISNGTLTLSLPADWSGAKTMQLNAYKSASGTLYPSEPVELTLVVREINDPPRVESWTPVADVTMTEGQTRTFTIEASDPEHLQPVFHWFLDEVPLGTSLATYTLTAAFDMAGSGQTKTLVLRVDADDGTGGHASLSWNVTVVDLPRPPVAAISSPLEGNRGYTTGTPLTFFASAFDPDGDVLTYTWSDSSGATLFTTATGSYTFTTPGTRRVTLTVSDGVLSVTSAVNVTVEQATQQGGGLPGFDAPAIAGALAVAAAVAVVARRRKDD